METKEQVLKDLEDRKKLYRKAEWTGRGLELLSYIATGIMAYTAITNAASAVSKFDIKKEFLNEASQISAMDSHFEDQQAEYDRIFDEYKLGLIDQYEFETQLANYNNTEFSDAYTHAEGIKYTDPKVAKILDEYDEKIEDSTRTDLKVAGHLFGSFATAFIGFLCGKNADENRARKRATKRAIKEISREQHPIVDIKDRLAGELKEINNQYSEEPEETM